MNICTADDLMNVTVRRRLGACVALALLLGCGSSALVWAQDNLLPDAGFEQVAEKTGLPVSWDPWNPQANLAAYTLATAHSGVASAMITDDSAEASQGLRSRRVPIEPGQTYEASVWVKIESLKAANFALYIEFWLGANRVANYSVGTEKVGEWVKLQIAKTAPESAKEATVIIYGSSATVGRAYFDDAALEKVPPQ